RPGVTGGQTNGSENSSLVSAAPFGDATPEMPTGLRAASPDIANEPPRTLHLSLPEAATTRLAGATATESSIAPHASAASDQSPRSRVAAGGPPGVGATMVEIKPHSAAIIGPDGLGSGAADGITTGAIQIADATSRVVLPPIRRPGGIGGTGTSETGD